MPYYAWVPLLVIVCVFSALTSKRLNDTQSWNWFIGCYFCSIIPIWTFVAKYTKNMVFDGLLYDCVLKLSFYGMLFYLGTAAKFSMYQYCGVIFILIGFLLMEFS